MKSNIFKSNQIKINQITLPLLNSNKINFSQVMLNQIKSKDLYQFNSNKLSQKFIKVGKLNSNKPQERQTK